MFPFHVFKPSVSSFLIFVASMLVWLRHRISMTLHAFLYHQSETLFLVVSLNFKHFVNSKTSQLGKDFSKVIKLLRNEVIVM